MDNMKTIIHHNLIKNCPVTTEYENLTNIIFGPDISTLKRWSTRPKPVQVIDDSIDIPKELISSSQLLYLDIYVMFINTQPMLTTIDKSIKYRFLVPLYDRSAEELNRGLETEEIITEQDFLWNELIVTGALNQ